MFYRNPHINILLKPEDLNLELIRFVCKSLCPSANFLDKYGSGSFNGGFWISPTSMVEYRFGGFDCDFCVSFFGSISPRTGFWKSWTLATSHSPSQPYLIYFYVRCSLLCCWDLVWVWFVCKGKDDQLQVTSENGWLKGVMVTVVHWLGGKEGWKESNLQCVKKYNEIVHLLN